MPVHVSLLVNCESLELPNGRCLSAALFNAQSICNKSVSIVNIISEHKLDLLMLTETPHECTDDISLKRNVPCGYRCIEVARSPQCSVKVSKKVIGRGVALIYRSNYTAKSIAFDYVFTTFELLGVKL